MPGEVLQVIVSLAVVLGLMWLAARALKRTGVARGGEAIELLARQPLSRNSAVAVVRIADRALVLGVAEQGVTLVAETDLEAIRASLAAPVRERRRPVVPEQDSGAHRAGGPRRAGVGGSALSPQTWRTAVDVLRDRTTRRV